MSKKTAQDNCSRAKQYLISSTDVPEDLERCWSACNGIDGFGHEDAEIFQARKKHGETLDNLTCCPRLILFRRKLSEPLEAKLWTTRSLGYGDDDRLILASVAKAMIGLPADSLEISLWDWAPDKPMDQDFEGRFELSIEVCGLYKELRLLKTIHKAFYRHFDEGSWK